MRGALIALVPATLAFGLAYALLVLAAVRLLSLGLRAGLRTRCTAGSAGRPGRSSS